MADVIKTWPAFMEPRKVLKIFADAHAGAFSMYYFTLGRGKPKQEVEHLWFTYRGRILGRFKVDEIVCNVGQLPPLRRIDGSESEWQIKRDRYVAICSPPFTRLKEKVYMGPFRGFHYFNFDEYVASMESRVAI
jgi:hypothetical protein